MTAEKTNIFISHIADERVEAERAKEYLEKVFSDHVEVFVASNWSSIAPGEDWFSVITVAIETANVMLVLCSADSVGRSWIQFETGAGWFSRKTTVIPVCHKGMTPGGLPEPISRLQAIDINAEGEAEQLKKLANAVQRVAGLPKPAEIAVGDLGISSTGTPSLKGWVLRPAAHIGEEIEGVFKVASVGSADQDRASAAGLDANDTVFVRLLVEPPTGQFVNAMACDEIASVFEREDVPGAVFKAKIKLRAVYQSPGEDDRRSPVIVIEEAKKRAEQSEVKGAKSQSYAPDAPPEVPQVGAER